MSYYILSDKNETQIKGIFNKEEIIPEDNAYLIPYQSNTNLDRTDRSIDTDDDILYIFFQNPSEKIENIKIFDTIEKAQFYRENNNSYGYIIGFKINILYKSLLQCEYLSVKEIH